MSIQKLQIVLATAVLGLSCLALADDHPTGTDPAPAPVTISDVKAANNPKGEGSCTAGSPQDSCGTCSISCPTGQSAVCMPGQWNYQTNQCDSRARCECRNTSR